jgi:hypothetical protein
MADAYGAAETESTGRQPEKQTRHSGDNRRNKQDESAMVSTWQQHRQLQENSHNEGDRLAATTAEGVQEGADKGARAVEAQRVCSASSQQNEMRQ